VQNLGKLPLAAVLKYDWYDPNTDVSGNDIGQNHTAKGNIAQNTFGFGMLWNMNASLPLQAYYEVNGNEKTDHLARFETDRNDDVFTLRLQYKF